VRERSFIQAHGSSTPQNRITESMIFDKVAKSFCINNWPVTAVKAFFGHPLGPASGDQLSNTLGVFEDGILPGIKTTSKVAEDVLDENLDIVLQDRPANIEVAFLNSKGFGGNNATATVFAPKLVESMLEKRYGSEMYQDYVARRETVREIATAYDERATNGDLNVIYNFGEGIIEDHEIALGADSLNIDKFANPVDLAFTNPYADMAND